MAVLPGAVRGATKLPGSTWSASIAAPQLCIGLRGLPTACAVGCILTPLPRLILLESTAAGFYVVASIAAPQLCIGLMRFTHGLRRGLHSYAAPAAHTAGIHTLPEFHAAGIHTLEPNMRISTPTRSA